MHNYFKTLSLPIGISILFLCLYYLLPYEADSFLPEREFVYGSFVPVERHIDSSCTVHSPQRINPVRITGPITFAGDTVPLVDAEVYERLDRELLVNTFWHSNTLLNMKLAHKYFPVIEPILSKNNVPDDFKYLAIAESGLRHVVSPAGAAGFWQFMKATAKEYDLMINDEVDERYHIEKSTQAACEYLLDAKEKFGSWTLAAAAYNMGGGGLEKQLSNQKADNYFDLYLNTETSRYVFRIIALKLIFEDPTAFGIHVNESDFYEYQAHEIIEVDSVVSDLAGFAIDYGTTYKTLKVLNPWIKSYSLSGSNDQSFYLKFPTE